MLAFAFSEVHTCRCWWWDDWQESTDFYSILWKCDFVVKHSKVLKLFDEEQIFCFQIKQFPPRSVRGNVTFVFVHSLDSLYHLEVFCLPFMVLLSWTMHQCRDSTPAGYLWYQYFNVLFSFCCCFFKSFPSLHTWLQCVSIRPSSKLKFAVRHWCTLISKGAGYCAD